MPDPQPIDLSDYAAGNIPSVTKRKTRGGEDFAEHEAAREAAKSVANRPGQLAGKTIEELAELAIRRMANVVLRGGDEFLPTSLKEASDTAKVWASVASMSAATKAGKGSGQAEDDPAVKAVIAELHELQRKGGKPK